MEKEEKLVNDDAKLKKELMVKLEKELMEKLEKDVAEKYKLIKLNKPIMEIKARIRPLNSEEPKDYGLF
jgi:protoheme ferro-lyase